MQLGAKEFSHLPRPHLTSWLRFTAGYAICTMPASCSPRLARLSSQFLKSLLFLWRFSQLAGHNFRWLRRSLRKSSRDAGCCWGRASPFGRMCPAIGGRKFGIQASLGSRPLQERNAGSKSRTFSAKSRWRQRRGHSDVTFAVAIVQAFPSRRYLLLKPL